VTYRISPPARPKRYTLSFPRKLWIAPALLVPLAVSGPNTVLALYALAVLTSGLGLLWRPGEPPILLFIFLWQWMQAATGALYGNALGISIADLHYYRGQHEFASGLMLTGLVVLAIAMRVAAGRCRLEIHEQLKALVLARPFKFWIRIYVLVWVFSTACEAIAPMAGGLRLPFLTMSGVKWAGFVLFTFAAFVTPYSHARKIWLLVFMFEFILSLGGFFSSFKEVFFFALLGVATANVRFGLRTLFPIFLLGAALIWLALVWTAVKGEYRTILNAGTGQQVVLLDYGDRVSELGRTVINLPGEAVQAAADDLLSRLMYHVFFGAAAQNVPSAVPHTYGAIWGEAISRPLMPRILFPNKRAINDSDLTNQYTGLSVGTAEQGVSISMGYMAEAYIDFGPIFMFLPIALLGAVLGFFYRWLIRQPGYKVVVGAALAPFALMPARVAETSILKMVPSLILTLLVSIVVIKFLAPKLLRSLSRANSLEQP
jgi:hypothetical protein